MDLNRSLSRFITRCLPRQCQLCRLTIDDNSDLKSDDVDLNKQKDHSRPNTDLPLWCATCCEQFFSHEPRCQRCGLETLKPTKLCGQCLVDPPAWDRLYCVNNYQFPLSKSVQDFKYHGQFWLAYDLATLLKAQIPQPAPECIAVPLHWRRLLSRGFNQSRSLAFQLVSQWQQQGENVSLNNQVFRRRYATIQQKGLNKKQRRKNLRGAFVLRQIPKYKHVAIIDDVVTTGSTLTPLCQALRKAGVERIDIYCLCRTPEPK
ncbi:ComF family protein [Vibrio sp. S11_S32]|uniref:ComF family protein n=1 Tax=Vibrio sp. S11_S32 TaxID=2720225 RepID=UPI001680AE7E|nr:ComF family protein [Vibrio sp. S11_S32]MBD1576000.1 ComF family protein [Vibrio sp. S11_S32]